MSDRSLGQGLPDDWDGARAAAREPHYGADPYWARAASANGTATAQARTTRPAAASPAAASPAAASPAAASPAAASPAAASRAAARRAAAVRRPVPNQAADTTGFLGALFDFGFTSFVTLKIVKVLYTLVTIGTVVSTLAFTILLFKASAVFGIVALVFVDPLVILVILAIYRIFLEFFVVIFRAAEDIRALREHGETG
jgi:hypothetical protein